jgi:hypothetical protein
VSQLLSRVWRPPIPVAIATPRLTVDGVVFLEPVPGVPPGLERRDDGELCGAVEPPSFDPVQDLRRFHRCLGCDLDREIVGPVGLDPADPGCAGQQCCPGARGVTAQRCRGPDAGDDDSDSCHVGQLLRVGDRPSCGELNSAGSPLDVCHGVADRLEVLGLLVGNADAELLLAA